MRKEIYPGNDFYLEPVERPVDHQKYFGVREVANQIGVDRNIIYRMIRLAGLGKLTSSGYKLRHVEMELLREWAMLLVAGVELKVGLQRLQKAI